MCILLTTTTWYAAKLLSHTCILCRALNASFAQGRTYVAIDVQIIAKKILTLM